MCQHFIVGSAVFLLGLTAIRGQLQGTHSVGPHGACAITFSRCSGGDLGSQVTACCKDGDHCVRKNHFYAQCRPIADPFPATWPDAAVVTTGNNPASKPAMADPAPSPAPESSLIINSTGTAVGASMANVTSETCGSMYMATAMHTCGGDCSLSAQKRRLDTTDDCLAACESHSDCHCAIFDTGVCSLMWTPCDSAVLNITNSSSSAATALQPCIDYPIATTDATPPVSKYADCKPMKLYPGHIITEQGCTGSCSRTLAEGVIDVDTCISACVQAGYAVCKAILFKPAGSFGLDKNECTMFSTGVKTMGVHATAQVLARGGLGAVMADFCEPPLTFSSFPANEFPDHGVDWVATCAGKQMAVVPGMQMGCGPCAFIPEGKDKLTDHLDEYHFESDSIEDCMADCASDPDCGCAFFRISDNMPESRGGWCSLSTADCADPVVGAQVDYTRAHSAIAKCSYSASADVMARWPEEPYEGIDWFAEWADVCAYPDPYMYHHKNTFCGPDCIVPGTYTSRNTYAAACASRCKAVSGCACSYFHGSTGMCTLMQGDMDGTMEGYSPACKNWDHVPGAMQVDVNGRNSNQVTLLCSADRG
eukprot:jgi/Ulvmu1/7280/UM035_0068.1